MVGRFFVCGMRQLFQEALRRRGPLFWKERRACPRPPQLLQTILFRCKRRNSGKNGQSSPKFRENRLQGGLYLRQGRRARPTVYSGGLFVRAQHMGNSPNISKILKKSEKTVVFLLTFTGIYGIVFKLSQESSSKTPDKQSDRRNLSKNFQKT